MTVSSDVSTEEQQLDALSPEVVAAYASGKITWSQIRERLGVLNFGLVLRRLGEENLRLPRAAANRPTQARAWLREALQQASAQ